MSVCLSVCLSVSTNNKTNKQTNKELRSWAVQAKSHNTPQYENTPTLKLTEIPEKSPDHLQHNVLRWMRGHIFHGNGQVPQIQKPDLVVEFPELLLPDLRVLRPEVVPKLGMVLLPPIDHVRAPNDDLHLWMSV